MFATYLIESSNVEFENPKEGLIKKRKIIKEAKGETPRRIELVCLKNRFSKPSFSCVFNYYPAHDLFVPADDDKNYETPWGSGKEYEKSTQKRHNVF